MRPLTRPLWGLLAALALLATLPALAPGAAVAQVPVPDCSETSRVFPDPTCRSNFIQYDVHAEGRTEST